jgi:predicted hotdog family 3-hydroxylacyl-ACP dehydratase
MIDKPAIRALILHAGNMCLLDSVEQWNNERIQCATRTHRDPDHPLRCDGALSAIHLVEYASQAAALHGALLARNASAGPAPGMLAAIRNLQLSVDRIDTLPQALTIVAVRRLAQTDGVLYEFQALCDSVLLGEGRLAIALSWS